MCQVQKGGVRALLCGERRSSVAFLRRSSSSSEMHAAGWIILCIVRENKAQQSAY
jgi:hypothetical protein